VKFAVWPARLELEAHDHLELPCGAESNLFRGALGAAIRSMCGCEECSGGSGQCIYRRYFKPQWQEGPSGYRDAPRPFVLRVRSLTLVELVFFELEPPWELFEQAFALAAKRVGTRLVRLEIASKLCLPVTGEPACGNLRLEFVTPIEVKDAGTVMGEPQFAPLIRRLAERVQALGTLYQRWPAEWDLRCAMEEAENVKLVNWDWARSEAVRRSSSNGHVHSIGGFTGWAEYVGPVGKFGPLLEIGSWTGVGRQTVWGKGEIRVR
jgi:hypothetical protein